MKPITELTGEELRQLRMQWNDLRDDGEDVPSFEEYIKTAEIKPIYKRTSKTVTHEEIQDMQVNTLLGTMAIRFAITFGAGVIVGAVLSSWQAAELIAGGVK